MSEREPHWEIRVFFDGQCPLCTREIALIRRLDRNLGRVDLVDLAAPDFVAAQFGLEQEAIEARIHGALPDGRIVEGVEVFTRIYEAVGLRWLAAPAKWPGIRRLLDWAYIWFARNRLRLTGRTPAICEVPAPESPAPASPHE